VTVHNDKMTKISATWTPAIRGSCPITYHGLLVNLVHNTGW